MSEFVLNRKYELQLPDSFVDIDRDEMEYIDGGWSFTRKFSTKAGINALYKAGAGYSIATLILAFGVVITGATGIGAVAFGLVGAYSGTLTWKCLDSTTEATYYYNRYGSYYLTVAGIGPLITGVRVDQL
ncbi:hypothetical protein SAMN05428976_11911 [Clostridium sp. USBA 49]|uniref:hypothetical protein n=1 Tax=Clostridium sp. USBA 49 TaxID=1881060 RepID=UPI00099B1D51|nr:hypothetical protein [Clostridium sp. USBA 49]SKA92194.1 hypothetical protein SAMN05428976_11911 [Clostridium sp. USBA 49]